MQSESEAEVGKQLQAGACWKLASVSLPGSSGLEGDLMACCDSLVSLLGCEMSFRASGAFTSSSIFRSFLFDEDSDPGPFEKRR